MEAGPSPSGWKKVSGKADFNFGDYRKLLEGDFILSTKAVNGITTPAEGKSFPSGNCISRL
jgi:hypothetical protein